MYTDEWLHLNGVWLHYQDWPARDPSRAETVLLLHGLTQQSHAFDAVAARFAPRHRCLALDLRGRGESSWAPGTYTIPRYVADVLALLDAFGLEAVHLLGTSLGGLVGLSLAAAAPGRLRSLALNDIGPEIDPRGARVGAYAAAIPERFRDLAGAAAWALGQYPWLAGLPPEAVADTVRWAVRREPDGPTERRLRRPRHGGEPLVVALRPREHEALRRNAMQIDGFLHLRLVPDQDAIGHDVQQRLTGQMVEAHDAGRRGNPKRARGLEVVELLRA